VNGEVLNIEGQQTVSFVVDGRDFSHTFLVCSLPTDAAVLFGTDFLNEAGASIDFGCGKMSLTDIGKALRACKFSPIKARNSLFLQRVKRDTALDPVYGRRSSSQPAPIARRLLPRTKFDSLSLKKYYYCPQVSTNCDGNIGIEKRTNSSPVSLHRSR